MQTILLCEYYARFRGKKKTSHLPSSQFRLLYQNVSLFYLWFGQWVSWWESGTSDRSGYALC